MGYIFTESILGETGKIARVQTTPQLNFGQIFTGSPQFYPGSMIQVQEEVSIITRVVDANLVGASYEWFYPKLRLGTYQIVDQIGQPYGSEPLSGYISNTITKVSAKSFYTITANPNVLVAQHEQIALDTCNAYLQPEVYLFPGESTPVAGFRFRDLNPAFLGSITLSKAPLADTPFNQVINGLVLNLKPGVEGVELIYRVAVINDIYTDYPSAAVPSCEFISASCQSLFAAFLAEQPGSPGNQFTGRYEDIGTCETNSLGPCNSLIWVCPNDPTFTRPYYTPSPV